jgi:chemotaxis protein methyltransferase CheR
MITAAQNEVTLDPDSFRSIAELAYRESGLTLVEEKTSMIQSRLRHRLRALKLDDFAAYCTVLNSDAGQSERRHLISALTTNVSHFFREAHHYEKLAALFDSRLSKLRAGGQMRIWSAGCSNGQEAVSAAITLAERTPEISNMNLKILATDIDQNVIRFARTARYPQRLMRGVTAEMRETYFGPPAEENGEKHYPVSQSIRQMIQFNALNLLGPWPIRTKFEVIFCRNVVIYFDAQTQERLWPRFHQVLHPDGLLFLGHSERIAEPEKFGFECIGPTTYRPLPQ